MIFAYNIKGAKKNFFDAIACNNRSIVIREYLDYYRVPVLSG